MQEAIKIYGTHWGLGMCLFDCLFVCHLIYFFNAVATFIGNRTSVQCTNRNHAVADQRNSGRWMVDEDTVCVIRLECIIVSYSVQWNLAASELQLPCHFC